ncbi:hypothetical protein [Mangrovimonas spongiae]|uniref:50S ribosomal protein L27 n=1 Tax=Mangrovimonas spongiae TaxID=2494697 RepID=A0A3R9MVG5_9FLAO|nr:hypothetical protein [Mangrovimonas spongiae]RSK41723.1 hypothetical protein EJA19_02255 [Mangrovimonas spongiae]
MYDIVKTLHSYWAYIVLLILFIAVINSLVKRAKGKDYLAFDFRISLFTLIVSHLQLLIGLVLYFVSPRFELWSELGGGVMSNSLARLYLVEHPFVNILAIALITIGYSKHKKKLISKAKFNTIAIFYTIALVLFLSRIPWDAWLG